MRKIIIAPSLLAADRSRLVEETLLALENGADWLHFDVMDKIFVPNDALKVEELASLRKATDAFLDVHLMIVEPLKYVSSFIDAGASLITFHEEVLNDYSEFEMLVKMLKERNVKVGLSIKPLTPVEVLSPYLKDLDLVLVMGVEPGKGGQKFIDSALDKIAYLRKIIDKNGYDCLIEIDGGITNETGKLCKEAGVDVLVAGSYLFNKKDMKERIELLR